MRVCVFPPGRPDLIEFHKLTRSNATHNLQQAFNVAEHHLGLTKLLDPEGEEDALNTVSWKILSFNAALLVRYNKYSVVLKLKYMQN